MNKKNILVLFGGKSTEHEVSIISGIQVLNALDKSIYNVLPVCITKSGEWVRGDESFLNPETFKDLDKAIRGKARAFVSPDATIDSLVEKPSGMSFLKNLVKDKIDVVIPVFHGHLGEDGSIQGLLEMANLPFVGCGVEASAIGMDKSVSKLLAESVGIPVMKGFVVKKGQEPGKVKFPVFVKPVHLGSSIGITKAKTAKELTDALEVAFFYDNVVLVEEALQNAREINVSVIGNDPYEVSACEEPVKSSVTLSFEDKYIDKKGSSKGMATAKRILPARIKKETSIKIEDYALKFFKVLGGEGLARIDFLMSEDEKKIYFNEINTMPGSLAFYLWKEKGIPFNKLLDRLIDLALKSHERKNKLQTTFKSNILEGFGGAKGTKLKN